MATIAELVQQGKDLGYTGDTLKDFVTSQQAIARDERAKEREVEKAKYESEIEKVRRKLELEKAKLDMEKEMEGMRLELEKAKIDRQRQSEAMEMELAKAKLSSEVETAKLASMEWRTANDGDREDIGEVSAYRQHSGREMGAREPKLPVFNQNKDQMDSYLSRFEKYAEANKWAPERWALNLSALLTGSALEVYDRLSSQDAGTYDTLKAALLLNFGLTEDGFKKKFRDSRPEASETFQQYVNRIGNYLQKWLEMASVGKTYQELCDFLIRDQMLDICNRDLYLFLKQKGTQPAVQSAKEADLYAEPRGGTKFVLRGDRRDNRTNNQKKQENDRQGKPSQYHSRPIPRCGHCSGNHATYDCRKRGQVSVAAVTEDETEEQKGYRSNRGRGWNRRRGSGYTAGRGRGGNHVSNSCYVENREKKKVFDQAKREEKPRVNSDVQTGSCLFRENKLPTAKGRVNGREVTVMRDTGCTGVIIRRKLVEPEQMLGKRLECTLVDQSVVSNPVAKIRIDCPFFKGTTEAVCMDNTLYDVTLGNIDGSELPTMKDFQGVESSAVQTRQQKRNEERSYEALKVPDQIADISRDEFKEEQRKDEDLQKIWTLARAGGSRRCRGSGEIRFIIKKDLLYREYTGRGSRTYHQIAVPSKYRQDVMKVAHESLMAGHLGVRKTLDRVQAEFYWPGISGDVTRYCRSCDICQRTIAKGRVTRIPLGKMPLIDVPFKRVAVDIVGPIVPVTERKNRYILTMIDYATRYPEAIALPGIETERVAEALVDMFSRLGIPEEMLTDCGAQFVSKLMKEVSKLLSIKQLTTTPYHPMCNGLVERLNGHLKQTLKRMCAERPKDWDKYLNAVLFAIREVPQESLGFSPFELLYGRRVRGPMAILKELWSGEKTDDEIRTTYQYVVDLRNRLEETCEEAQKNLSESSKRYKTYYNKRTKDRKFREGDQVLVLRPKKQNKLLLHWRGPYTVIEVVNAMDYRIKVDGKVKIYHANLLKKYIQRERSEIAQNIILTVNAAVIEEENMEGEEKISGDLSQLADEMICPTSVDKEGFQEVSISDELTTEQKEELRSLMEEFQDVFSDRPGKTNILEHDIELSSTGPIRTKGYPIPFHSRQVVEEELTKMLDLGVVEPSKAPYSSPVVLVVKKDKSYRFCIDFRAINKVTVFDAEPMPNIEEIFAKMAGHRYYSKFDLCKGYWQVPLTEKAKPLTSFETPKGLYQFTMLPFGLVNAGATFCRLMRIVLDGLKKTDSFVDDIIVFTLCWSSHMLELRGLFERLRKARLTAKPSKCSIGHRSIECLGHEVGGGKQSLKPLNDKVEAIKAAKRPETKKQVRAFLGLAGFYRKFIPNFATIAVPLTNLTKKGTPNKVIWGDREQKAFENLKVSLSQYPILALPDLEKPFILRTDASETGVGAVLLQNTDEGKLPIAYASKKLLPRETRYSVIEKECLAIVWGVQKFQRYLFGRAFLLETDHEPLVYLQRAKTLNPRIMRWALALQPYRFNIRAIKGQDNVGADYLSRLS